MLQSINILSVILKRIPVHMVVAVSAWISRIVTALVQIISVRILIDSLGIEQYAAFALLSSLIGWYMLTDMCIGISLQNHISECRANEKSYNDYIVVAAMIDMTLLVLMITLLYFISPYIAPVFLKHFGFMSVSEKVYYFFVVGALCISVSIGGIAYKIWYAEQKGYLSNIVPAIASLIAFGGIWLVTQSEIHQKLFWSLVAFITPSALFAIISFCWQITGVFKQSWRVNLMLFNRLMKRAGHFWFFAIMAAVVLQIDYIVMSQFLTSQDIVIYNISTKIFGLIFFIYNAILYALWPVCSEVIVRNNWETVIGYLKKYLVLGAGLMLISMVLLVLLMPNIVKILSPSKPIIVPTMFIILLGLYQIVRVWTDTFAMVLQSMSDLRPFWVFVPLQALISGSLQWLLVPIYGIYGVVFGLIGSFVFTVFWALPLAVHRHIKISNGLVI